MRWRIVTTAIATLLLPTEAKFVSGHVGLSLTAKQHLVSQFACGIGECEYSFQFKVDNALVWSVMIASSMDIPPAQIRLGNFTHVRFRHVLDEDLESGSFNVCTLSSARGRVDYVRLPTDGTVSVDYRGKLKQTVRPHVWYFFVDDCFDALSSGLTPTTVNRDVRESWHGKQPIFVSWTGSITQADGSHHSYEQWGTWKFVLFELVCYTTTCLIFLKHEIEESKFGGGIHNVIQGFNIAIMFQLSALVAEFVDLLVMSQTGRNMWLFHILKDAFGSIAQIIIGCVLLFVALGHSLACPPMMNGAVAVPIAIVFSLANLTIIVADQHETGVKIRFFAAEGLVGAVFVASRLLLWVAFLVALRWTKSSSTTPEKVKKFLANFGVAGSLYFLAFPIVYLLTSAFAPYLRHHVVTLMTFAVQFTCSLWLGKLFLSRKGDFYQISCVSQSLLPGGYLSFSASHRID